MTTAVTIERWSAEHPRFFDLLDAVEAQQQGDWFRFEAEWHLASYTLVALSGATISGFLRFVVQQIGPELERPAVLMNDVALIEAKVLAFAVVAEARRQGIGLKLQTAALHWAHELGCYQLRSHSDGSNKANHALKLKMGFAVHPIIRGGDQEGVYFVMPLTTPDNPRF